jgi:hypothetical protein
MYSVSEIRRGLTDPKTALREINRLCHTRGNYHDRNPDGTSIFERDWDNLIILDACRYDSFAQQADFPGSLGHDISLGSNTPEFVRANFAGRQLHDTVYVTANSWFLRLRDEIDSELHHVHDLHWGDEKAEYHDDRFNIVPPDTLTAEAKRVAAEFPNKRLLVHYIQPHHPFIGPTGQQYFNYPSSSLQEVIEQADDATGDDVRKAYRENLDIVLESVEELFEALVGRTVVTADHGEMLGDRHDYVPIRDFGHQQGLYNEPLTKVPWHVDVTPPRKRIVAEQPREPERDVDIDRVERRLEELGYKM